MTIEEIEREYQVQFEKIRNTGMPIPRDTDLLTLNVPIELKVSLLGNFTNIYLNQIEYNLIKKKTPDFAKIEFFETFDCGFVDFVVDHPNPEYRTEILRKLRDYDNFRNSVCEVMDC